MILMNNIFRKNTDVTCVAETVIGRRAILIDVNNKSSETVAIDLEVACCMNDICRKQKKKKVNAIQVMRSNMKSSNITTSRATRQRA